MDSKKQRRSTPTRDPTHPRPCSRDGGTPDTGSELRGGTLHKHADSPEARVAEINRLLRGWAEYFNQGPVIPTYKLVRWYVQRRLQRWLTRRGGQTGTGYRQYPDEYLYEVLGLHPLPLRRADLPSAKA